MLTPISNPLKEEAEEESVDLANFVERMVPFYAQCLIEVGVFFPLSSLSWLLLLDRRNVLDILRRHYFSCFRSFIHFVYIDLSLYYRIPRMGSSAHPNSALLIPRWFVVPP